MRRVYSWGPIQAVLQAEDIADAYVVTLASKDFNATPMILDARWGAEDASKIALNTFYQAWKNPKAFFAIERLEAGHMSVSQQKLHVEWAATIIDDAARFGDALEEAIAISEKLPEPVDVTNEIQLYLDLVDFGTEAAVAGLIQQGYSEDEARRVELEQSQADSRKRFKLVPRLRSARSSQGHR